MNLMVIGGVLLVIGLSYLFIRKFAKNCHQTGEKQEIYDDQLEDRMNPLNEMESTDRFTAFSPNQLPLKDGTFSGVELREVQDQGKSLPRQLLGQELAFK
jgi:hypothetical protein